MDLKNVKKSLPYLLHANIAPNLVGEPGIGKTSIINQYAAENQHKIFRLNLGNQDVGDIIGLADFTVDDKGNKVATKFMMPQWALELKEFAESNPDKYAIIFLDEINRASRRDVLQAIFPLILEKRLHTTQMPENTRIIAAMNPGGDEDFVTELGEALLSRFCHIKTTVTSSSFIEYAENNGVSFNITSFLRDQPEMLMKRSEFNIPDRTPDSRAWEMVDSLIKINVADSEPALFQELCYGIIGHTTAIAFIKSLNNADKPLSANDVFDDFTKDKQKLIKKYTDDEKNRRLDILKHTIDSVMNVIDFESMDKKRNKNLLLFIKLIPKDLAYDLMRSLTKKDERFLSVMEQDQDVVNIAKHSKIARAV